MKRHLKRKQSELLHNNLSFMAAGFADVEDSFQQVKQFTAHARMESSQIGMSSFSLQINSSESGSVSFFSSPHVLSNSVTHTINVKIEKIDVFIFTSKHMDRKTKLPLK